MKRAGQGSVDLPPVGSAVGARRLVAVAPGLAKPLVGRRGNSLLDFDDGFSNLPRVVCFSP